MVNCDFIEIYITMTNFSNKKIGSIYFGENPNLGLSGPAVSSIDIFVVKIPQTQSRFL